MFNCEEEYEKLLPLARQVGKDIFDNEDKGEDLIRGLIPSFPNNLSNFYTKDIGIRRDVSWNSGNRYGVPMRVSPVSVPNWQAMQLLMGLSASDMTNLITESGEVVTALRHTMIVDAPLYEVAGIPHELLARPTGRMNAFSGYFMDSNMLDGTLCSEEPRLALLATAFVQCLERFDRHYIQSGMDLPPNDIPSCAVIRVGLDMNISDAVKLKTISRLGINGSDLASMCLKAMSSRCDITRHIVSSISNR